MGSKNKRWLNSRACAEITSLSTMKTFFLISKFSPCYSCIHAQYLGVALGLPFSMFFFFFPAGGVKIPLQGLNILAIQRVVYSDSISCYCCCSSSTALHALPHCAYRGALPARAISCH